MNINIKNASYTLFSLKLGKYVFYQYALKIHFILTNKKNPLYFLLQRINIKCKKLGNSSENKLTTKGFWLDC